MFRIFRLTDGHQFVGNFSELPTIGNSVRVGKTDGCYADSPEYWTTGVIKEILDQTDNKVVFKTKSSIYIWERL